MVPELASCLDSRVIFIGEQVADLTNEDMVLKPDGNVLIPEFSQKFKRGIVNPYASLSDSGGIRSD